MNKKLPDSEIVKALKCCISSLCAECPFKAIKGLKNIFSENELDLPCQDSLEVMEIAIKVLEKQIPKKVKSIDENHSYYVCGNCDTAIYYSDMPKSHKYCLNCGQALDWGDSE